MFTEWTTRAIDSPSKPLIDAIRMKHMFTVIDIPYLALTRIFLEANNTNVFLFR